MNAALFPDIVVNGERIPSAVVAAEAQNHDAPKNKPGIAWRKAANALAIRTLLLQEARRRGLQADPAETGPGRRETEEEALIRGLLEEAVSVDAPSDEDVRREWQKDPARFRSPPLWEVSHILCACDPHDDAARKDAYARAADLTAQAMANPARFSCLARDHSDCGSKSSGGALGQVGPGDTVPEFEAALRGLTDGQITTEPVLTRHGWHIVRMDAVATGSVLPFGAVKEKISDAIEKANWARRSRSFVNQLVACAEISGADLRAL